MMIEGSAAGLRGGRWLWRVVEMDGAKLWVSRVLLFGALAVFAAAHGLEAWNGREPGWMLWRDLWWLVQAPEQLADPVAAVAVASFLTFTLLILVAPFLERVWVLSRLAWGLVTAFSGIAMVGFWAVIVINWEANVVYGPGGWCFMIAPVLNVLGMLVAYPPPREVVDPRCR